MGVLRFMVYLMHIDGWVCLNSKHEQMRKIMISSHHKVRFELVVPTNDGILVLSLLHRFVLTLDTPSLTSGDVIRLYWLMVTDHSLTPLGHWWSWLCLVNVIIIKMTSRPSSSHLSPSALDCLLGSPDVLARLAKVLSSSFPPGEGDL